MKDKAKLGRKALVIIDYQNGVLVDPLPLNAMAVLDRIRILADDARRLGHAVVYIQHEEAGTAFEHGSQGWAFPQAIAPQPGDIVVGKRSCDAFRETELADRLREAGVTDLYVCGYASDFCVDSTVRQAASMGYRTTVFSDAHTARDRPFASAATIVAHHNWIWPEIINPGNPILVKTSAGADPFAD